MQTVSDQKKGSGLQIYTEPIERPEATGEESVWIEDGGLEIRWHKYSKEYYYRVVEPERFELIWIKAAKITVGPRGGFYKFEMAVRLDEPETHIFSLSKSHKRLCQKIVLLLRQNKIPIIKDTVKKEGG